MPCHNKKSFFDEIPQRAETPKFESRIKYELGVIGAGQMGYAIIKGAVSSKAIGTYEIITSDPNSEMHEELNKMGIQNINDNVNVISKSKLVVLSVKPQTLPHLKKELASMGGDQTVISVMAGVSLTHLSEMCGSANVIRIMLNTACLRGKGVVCISSNPNVSQEILDMVEDLFRPMSQVLEHVPESYMDGITAVAGSGIAFVYQFVEALSDGGVHAGLPRKLSNQIAAQTVLGGADMALNSGKHVGQLKDEVASPGGTTIAGIRETEKHGLRSAIIEAVIAAAEKSKGN